MRNINVAASNFNSPYFQVSKGEEIVRIFFGIGYGIGIGMEQPSRWNL